jgi:hypothetical protein
METSGNEWSDATSFLSYGLWSTGGAACYKRGMSQTATALSSSSTETEALSADEVAEHAQPSVLAHLLRTMRHHIAQATDVMRQVATQTSDGEWEEQATHLRRIAAFVEDRVIALDLGQRSFLLPDQFQRFSTLLRQRRESAHPVRNRAEQARRAVSAYDQEHRKWSGVTVAGNGATAASCRRTGADLEGCTR